MLDGTNKALSDRVWDALAVPLARAGLTPNQITWLGLLLVLANCAVFYVYRNTFWFGIGLAISFTFDGLDGAVARMRGMSSRYGGYLDAVVDRDKVKEGGLRLTDVYDTLQVYLGSAYVNDFNLFGRTYSVYAQADAPFRDEIGDVARLQVRNDRGNMVPLGSVVDLQQAYGPDPVVRYNGYPAADVTATPFSTDVSGAEAVRLAHVRAADRLQLRLEGGAIGQPRECIQRRGTLVHLRGGLRVQQHVVQAPQQACRRR